MQQYNTSQIFSKSKDVIRLKTRKQHHMQLVNSRNGFTFVELLVVLVIIAIFAAIAIPSYRNYVIKNAEDEAKAQMQQLQIQLERWRASALSYKGFYPQSDVSSDGKPIYEYSDNVSNGGSNTEVYVPLGSNSNNYRYKITLVDSANQSLTDNNTVGRSWKMLAIPNKEGSIGYDGDAFILTSTGKRCQKPFIKNAEVDINASCSSTDEVW